MNVQGQRVLISGAGGLIGRHVSAALRHAGATVVPLVRGAAKADNVWWSPEEGKLDPAAVSGFDAVVHLAGEPVVGRWTAEKKRRIRDSRVAGTATLARALAAADAPPRVLVTASGINFYGNTGDRVVDESAPHGSGFLAEVSAQWEAAADPLRAQSRVVSLRIGVVLSSEGGTLGALLPLFRLGLGANIGDGAGYVSWVTLHDLVRAIEHVIGNSEISGAVNVVAPEPVTSAAFNRALGLALHKPVWLRVPPWAARLMLGEMADETVLGSVRALPRRLLDDGFVFDDAKLPEALAACLSSWSR